MFRAVIFDFDGVIVDSEPLHLKAFNTVLAQFGIKISNGSYYNDYLGFTDFECFSRVAEKNNLRFDQAGLNDLINRKCEVFADLARTGGGIIKAVPQFLEMLSKSNIRRAICSGALLCDIELMLDGSGLQPFFEVVVTAEDVTKGKPDPEGFLLALQRLNESSGKESLTANNCVVIEDSHWGLEAAGAAGMHTVAVTSSYAADELSMAEKVVAGLDELSINDLQRLCE